uniref:ShKT domain-containing protein n=1 Tax=Strongyloides stercoralis TaxID=6248 RepID=A0A0K0E546_STRER
MYQYLSFLLLLTTLIIGIISSQQKYSLYTLKPETQKQVNFLKHLEVNGTSGLLDTKLDFWQEPTVPGRVVQVMIKEYDIEKFTKMMETLKISHNITIPDVEKVIKKRASEAKEREAFEKAYKDSSIRRQSSSRRRVNFSHTQYHSFGSVINYLNSLAITFPDRVHVQPIGTTHEGRQIPLIKIGTEVRANKPAIWIDGGIHAREWVSPSVVLYFIDQLVNEYERKPYIRNLVDSIDWYIVPLLNPDGYEHSRSSTDPETRLWRKNKSPQACITVNSGFFAPPKTQCCQGVDLNRNYDWFFGQYGSSTDPCSEIFQGKHAFSEPETRSVRDFIHKLNGQVKAFLTFHSYSQILMFPFGHQQRTYPSDVDDLRSTANRAAEALRRVYGTKYIVGTGSDTLYPASGGSEDWAKGKMGIKYAYLFELRPEESVYDGFLLREDQILPTARETWEALKVIASQTLTTFPAGEYQAKFTQTHRNNIASFSRNDDINFPSTCRDLDALCKYWADNGACQNWPSMRERCPMSCGFCR